MTTDEIKLRLATSLCNLVDAYFGNPTIGEKLINSTLKIIVKKNIYKVEEVLTLFKDENGNIDENEIISEYANQFGEEKVIINLKDYIHDNTIKSMLPDKALVIGKDDILAIINTV